MIVYSVHSDSASRKRFVYAEDVTTVLAGKSTVPPDIFYQGKKKASDWEPPAIEWFADNSRNLDKYKEPDISYCTPGSYILAPRAAELLRPVVSDVAELLPIPFQGETWYFMNVFNQIDAMDKERSRYKTYSTGERGWLEKPAFFADKVPHAKLFIVPQAPGRLYYAEHHPDPNPHTFKNVVERNKLFGIVIEKVWEN